MLTLLSAKLCGGSRAPSLGGCCFILFSFASLGACTALTNMLLLQVWNSHSSHGTDQKA